MTADLQDIGRSDLVVHALDAPSIALGLEQGEFLVVYQPICLPLTRHLIGYEALLRWRCNGVDKFSPDDFIALAEETGQIIDLGAYVLKKACAQLSELRRRGATDMLMSVNVSPQQMLNARDFISLVESELLKHRIPANRLQLEITERVPFNVYGKIDSLIRLLRRRGVRVVLDDIFSGYMTIEKVIYLGVDGLKMSPLCSSSSMRAYNKKESSMIEAIWCFCRSSDLTLVIEQVESNTQDQWLGRFEGMAVQGYYYGKPQPIEC